MTRSPVIRMGGGTGGRSPAGSKRIRLLDVPNHSTPSAIAVALR